MVEYRLGREMHSTQIGVIAVILGAGLAACHQTTDADLAKAAECVPVPEGQYFQFIDGKLVRIEPVDEDSLQRQDIAIQNIRRGLVSQGFSWLTVEWDGQTATIGGLAPTQNSRIDGFRLAKAAFENDRLIGERVQQVIDNIEIQVAAESVSAILDDAFTAMQIGWLEADVKNQVIVLHGTAPDSRAKQEAYRSALNAISIQLNNDDTKYLAVDAISVNGADNPVGEALLALATDPTYIDCDNAFFETMDDQAVSFIEGQAIVDNSSKPLMDTLTGIAHLCRAYEIEIRQHAAGPSDEVDVMELSQNRASAIRDQLSVFADRDAIIPRGFGFENPLDTSGTPDARARNQRTVFMVRERAD